MKSIVLLFAFTGIVSCITYDEILDAEWESFKVEHQKNYADEREEQLRKQIFRDNKELIDKHNIRYAAGESTYKMGVNQFTDLLHEEFIASFPCSLNISDFSVDYIYSPPTNAITEDSLDWRSKRAVTPVKHQKECGSCWAFAAAGTLEGHYYVKHKNLIDFSEQNLVDCSSVAPYTNEGCKCGRPQEALRYIKEIGLNPSSSYPYEGKFGACRFKKDHIGSKIVGSVGVPHGDEKALHTALAQGPISVTIAATHIQSYHSGVYNQVCSGTASFYHSMLLVGYGKDPKDGDYWLIKNSWGNWGESGYLRMARNKNNLCDIASYAVYPLM